MASLVWSLAAVLMGGLAIAAQHGQAPGQSIFVLPWMRASLVVDMLLGAWLIWWLVPRIDARRVKPTSACMAGGPGDGGGHGRRNGHPPIETSYRASFRRSLGLMVCASP